MQDEVLNPSLRRGFAINISAITDVERLVASDREPLQGHFQSSRVWFQALHFRILGGDDNIEKGARYPWPPAFDRRDNLNTLPASILIA